MRRPTSARAASPASRAPQRQGEHQRDRGRHEPPRVDTERHEPSGSRYREDDTNRGAPVVADHEVPPEAAKRPDAAHASATRLRRRSVTAEYDMSTTKTRTPRREALSPGQSTPAPSAAQKMPNDVNITPTANFSVFSGTRASGARTTMPTTATRTRAIPAPSAARPMFP